MENLLVLLVVSLILVVPTASTGSNSNGPPPCSLNGDLVDNKCVCDRPWKGEDCGILDVRPVSFPQGYGMAPNKTTWGADVFVTTTAHKSTATQSNNEKKTKYHLFVSSITGDCSLRSWGSHSRIEHAVADQITGPYQFHDIALPTFAHNPKLVDLSTTGTTMDNDEEGDGSTDGTLLALIHIGDGAGPDDAGKHCRKPPSEKGANTVADLLEVSSTTTNQRKRELLGGSSTIHLAMSVDGPWTPLLNSTLKGCNNPSPFVYHNDTDDDDDHSSSIYVVCSGGNHSVLMQTDHIWGPWNTISQITPFPKDDNNMQSNGGSSLHYEDPTLYIDSQRNAFHVIYHAYDTKEHPPHGHDCTHSTVSAHLFSPDGIHWYKSQGQPYGTQIEIITTGTSMTEESKVQAQAQTITVATRERPSLVFETQRDGKTAITHLVTAVCSAPNCPDGPPEGCVNCKYDHWDYTLIQPLNA